MRLNLVGRVGFGMVGKVRFRGQVEFGKSGLVCFHWSIPSLVGQVEL